MKKSTSNYSKKKNTELAWNWRLFPLQFVVALLPLVIYLYSGISGYSDYSWNSENDSYVDIFLHSKMVAFSIVTVLVLVLTALKLRRMEKTTRRNALKTFIPLLVYLGLVLLSTICSEDIRLSVFGAMDSKEPVLVLTGYVAVAFYAYLVIDTVEDVKQIVSAAIVGAGLMAFLGVLQTMGHDPLLTEGVQRLFVPAEVMENGSLQLKFPVGMAYCTLYNPNYVGTYVAMYVPLLLVGIVIFKQLWKKLVCGAVLTGLTVTLFTSQSRTGLIAIIAVLVMLFLFMGREVVKRWYLVIPGITCFVMIFLLIDTYRDNLLTNRLKQMFAIEKSQDALTGIDTTGNGVRVLYKDTEFTVMMPISKTDFSYVVLEQGEERTITYNEDRTYAYATLSSGDEIVIQTANYSNQLAFGLHLDGRDYYFTNQIVRGNYKYINREVGRLDECIMPANVFPGYEAVASGRGYVWGRSIPLLLDNFIVGSGPDTFAITFPQSDYVARYKSGFDNIIFTRPHNFYLQMGVQTGTMSLLAFLVFYATYFLGSCRRYMFRKFVKTEEWLGFAAFLCTIGFMASGLANDSLIAVSPVFYVVLGMGMLINHKFCPIVKKVKISKEEGTEN